MTPGLASCESRRRTSNGAHARRATSITCANSNFRDLSIPKAAGYVLRLTSSERPSLVRQPLQAAAQTSETQSLWIWRFCFYAVHLSVV